jgi:hypothetical protein
MTGSTRRMRRILILIFEIYLAVHIFSLFLQGIVSTRNCSFNVISGPSAGGVSQSVTLSLTQTKKKYDEDKILGTQSSNTINHHPTMLQ